MILPIISLIAIRYQTIFYYEKVAVVPSIIDHFYIIWYTI